jgi:hypothetical protein
MINKLYSQENNFNSSIEVYDKRLLSGKYSLPLQRSNQYVFSGNFIPGLIAALQGEAHM